MSSNRNTVARALHDLGGAAWFGGSLMGSVGLNGAAADVRDPIESTKVAQAGWGRWTPVNAVAIAAHLAGGAIVVWENKGRMAGQKGVIAATATKAALTAAALGMTAYTRVLGEQVMRAGDVPSETATMPSRETPTDVAAAQRRLHVLQWTVPALTGSVVVLSAYMGEQQRPAEVVRGAIGRGLRQFGEAIATGAVAGKLATKVFGKKTKTEVALDAVKHAPKTVAATEAAKWATRTGRTTGRAAAKAGRLLP